MKPSIAPSALAAILLTAAASPQSLAADPVFLGPTPYLSFADSPFKPLFPSSFSYFHLDDFETGIRTPGWTEPTGVVLPPGALTDSVDWDGPINGSNPATSLIPPGSVNGTGIEGSSWYNGATTSFTFTFNAALLGGKLPTHVGVVWTDVGAVFDLEFPETPPQGVAQVSIMARGPSGEFLGFWPEDILFLGDGFANGGTAEDHFFGVVYSGGISSFTIFTGNSNDWEVDHLQYGALNPVPEPEQWLMMALGLSAVAWRLNRRRTNASA